VKKADPVELRTLAVALLASLLLWNLPFGGVLLYPFKLLATWLHELSHGLAMMITGTVTRTEAVASWPYGGLNGSGPTKNDIWAGTVLELVVDVSEIASTNSFHAKKNVRIAAVNTPGAASGAITRTNVCTRDAPSTQAASPSSRGRPRKKAESDQMQIGRADVALGRTGDS
jgi:hypothetical protein